MASSEWLHSGEQVGVLLDLHVYQPVIATSCLSCARGLPQRGCGSTTCCEEVRSDSATPMCCQKRCTPSPTSITPLLFAVGDAALQPCRRSLQQRTTSPASGTSTARSVALTEEIDRLNFTFLDALLPDKPYAMSVIEKNAGRELDSDCGCRVGTDAVTALRLRYAITMEAGIAVTIRRALDVIFFT